VSGRIDGLDLLRGIAVGLVMLRHALPHVFPGAGVVGVVMFFALSGYLITGVLEKRPRLGDFYARRAWRLVPALLVLVVAVVLVTLVLDPLGDRDRLLKTVVVALTWTADLPFGHASDATYHLWTLALEEQFYLLWPATLLVLGPRRGLLLAAVATGLACLLTTWWLAEDPDLAYSLPTSWALCFVVGAAARLHRDRLRPPGWAAPVALTLLGVLSMVPLRGHTLTYLAGGPAIAVLTAALVLSWRTWATVTQPALRALVWLGTVSYAAYLWNYPLTLWLRPHAALAVALTLLAAALSWRYVEAPLQRRRVAVAA
jgi:peptidoglycan/LPS O-acetylase OafA/YrhL